MIAFYRTLSWHTRCEHLDAAYGTQVWCWPIFGRNSWRIFRGSDLSDRRRLKCRPHVLRHLPVDVNRIVKDVWRSHELAWAVMLSRRQDMFFFVLDSISIRKVCNLELEPFLTWPGSHRCFPEGLQSLHIWNQPWAALSKEKSKQMCVDRYMDCHSSILYIGYSHAIHSVCFSAIARAT